MNATERQEPQREPSELLADVEAEQIARVLAREAKRSETLTIRLSPAEKEMIQSLAAAHDVTVTDLLVTLARIAAEKMERPKKTLFPDAEVSKQAKKKGASKGLGKKLKAKAEAKKKRVRRGEMRA